MPHEFETLVVHAGIEPDPLSGAVMTPIYQTSTYAQAAPGQHRGYEYARTDNPTRTVLQTQLAALEDAAHALVFGSGMAAVDAVLNLLSAGDHVLAGDDLYGGTRRLFTRLATQRGIEFTFAPFEDVAEMAGHVQDNTKLVWFETPTNPTLKLVDLKAIAKFANEHGLVSVVDNTFMSPAFQRPRNHGIDIVMHSMTKFLNGHSDVVMGCLMFGELENKRLQISEGMSLHQRLRFIQNGIGAVPGPFDCWLVLRGIKTLAVRMDRIASNAAEIAQFLESQNRVKRVIYPGLESHPQHGLAKSQMIGMGGMISFELSSDLEGANRLLKNLKLFTLAESLGGVESLIEHPGIMTHASVPKDIRERLGISDSFIRLSIGIESANDLIADLESGLSHI